MIQELAVYGMRPRNPMTVVEQQVVVGEAVGAEATFVVGPPVAIGKN